MSVIIYNPKYFKDVNGRRVINQAHVKRFVWSHAFWNLKVGEMKKFPEEVGRNMLRLLNFLVEVTSKNIGGIKKEIEEKLYKCDRCDFETNAAFALAGHQRTHAKEKSVEIEGIEGAVPQEGKFRKQSLRRRSIEEEEGVAKDGETDRDGVFWYGKGVEDDQSDKGFTPKMS